MTAEEKESGANWSKIAAWVFGCWALMVPLGVSMVRNSFAELSSTNTAFQTSFNAYVLTMERRMVLVEERQLNMLKQMEELRLRDQMNGRAK